MDSEKALTGFGNFLSSMGDGSMREGRNKAMNTEMNGHTIDTVMPGDTKKWETGIERNGKWIIVEQYSNEKEAIEGHTKWVRMIKDNPTCELIDIDLWGLNKWKGKKK